MFAPVPRPIETERKSHVRLSSEPETPPGIEELFRKHAPAIASLGLAMLHSVEEADDLVQDVFIRAFRAIHRLEDPAGARPWLMTIAVRLARTRLRRRKLRMLLFQLDEPDFEQIPSRGTLPEHRDLVKRLYVILDKMPVELSIAFVLRYVQSETVPSVAELCGWSLSTAKRRIQAAHELVTAKLEAMPRRAGEPP